jgi:hypothetical protein
MPALHLFLFLQAMDVLTTMAGLRFGAHEANPVVRHAMNLGPVTGVLVAKILAFTAVAVFVWIRGLRQDRVLASLNYLFAAVVLWNVYTLLVVAPPALAIAGAR